MTLKTCLKLLFSAIVVTMVAVSAWATTKQSLLDWTGLTADPNRYWTIATLFDAYFGFLTFYLWVFYKERRAWPRFAWFVAIMALGNMAMASYVLLQLYKLKADEPVERILMRRAAAVG